ncbi:hypothetical protein OIU78_014751 [Salix suchowensis]|nr:hypothetical protein OIU78_014751 [Salix suchowensis]
MARSSFSVPSSAVLVPPFLVFQAKWFLLKVSGSAGCRIGVPCSPPWQLPKRGSFSPALLRLLRGTNLIRK